MKPIDETPDAQQQQIVHRFYDAFAARDIALLRGAVTPDWEYIPPTSSGQHGPDQMIEGFKILSLGMPDMRIEVLDVLTHHNRVAVRASVSGTQLGPLLGCAATSRPVEFAIHSFHELRDGRVAKTWHLEDWISVYRQIGALPEGFGG
jgi:predicted ester cyclase